MRLGEDVVGGDDRKIRRDRLIHGKSIKAIARERGVSRNTVRKYRSITHDRHRARRSLGHLPFG